MLIGSRFLELRKGAGQGRNRAEVIDQSVTIFGISVKRPWLSCAFPLPPWILKTVHHEYTPLFFLPASTGNRLPGRSGPRSKRKRSKQEREARGDRRIQRRWRTRSCQGRDFELRSHWQDVRNNVAASPRGVESETIAPRRRRQSQDFFGSGTAQTRWRRGANAEKQKHPQFGLRCP